MLTKQLSDEQLSQFDTEYVTDEMWKPIEREIARDFPSGGFSFLDLGGGNGIFADRILRAYPNSTGTVLDSSELLLSRNSRSPRKEVVLGDAMRIEALGQYDIIFCNWLLHHLVASSYRRTRQNIDAALHACANHLTPNGRFSLYDNDYSGYIDNAPSRLIFLLTSSKVLARVVKSMGANTAGVGVCFLSDREWQLHCLPRFWTWPSGMPVVSILLKFFLGFFGPRTALCRRPPSKGAPLTKTSLKRQA